MDRNANEHNDTKPVDQEHKTADTQFMRAETRDDILLNLLADGLTHAEAAHLAGCSAKTVQRCLLNDDFARKLARRRSIIFNDVTGRLAKITTKAVSTIEDTMEGENPTLRFRAATAIVNMALRFRDEHETERRLDSLERQASQSTPDAGF